MSLTVLARRAAVRRDYETEIAAGTRQEDAPRGGTPHPDENKWRDRVVTYIPAEALAATLALYPFLQSYAWARALVAAAIFAVAVPGWVWINYMREAKDDSARADLPAKAMLLGMFAYAVWLGTLPDTPYLEWEPWSTELGVIVTVAAGIVFVFLDAVGDTIGQHIRAKKLLRAKPQPAPRPPPSHTSGGENADGDV